MIDPATGNYAMLNSGLEVRNALAAGMFVMQGTEDEIRRAAERVKLGAAEQTRRAARRKAQRAARKRNRP